MKDLLFIFLVIFGGWIFVGVFLYGVRSCHSQEFEPLAESFGFLDLWIGSVERLAAYMLVLNAPRFVAVFIGGWTTLKFAAHWGKKPHESSGSLIALTGSVLSFGFALFLGVVMNHTALKYFGSLADGN